MSSAGFHEGSKRITRSAPVRVMPVPPAPVLHKRKLKEKGGCQGVIVETWILVMTVDMIKCCLVEGSRGGIEEKGYFAHAV